ncbi:hypothetical protein N1851_019296 [Merluccius polli]|uniref:Uncharacterized protein n=1 Tax=Merluccius polli TaxID=89951 RepID=A0AA47MMI6_MERPO|nr:hypothetical protein N1851_019296 [Merluccius polli]
METTDTPLAFLSVAPDSTGSSSFSPENISIVIEDEVVMSELPRLADAFVLSVKGSLSKTPHPNLSRRAGWHLAWLDAVDT